MTLNTEFIALPLERLRDIAHRMKDEGWRFIQTHAVYNDPNVDLYYSFMKNGEIINYRIEGVTKQDVVPSITDIFLAAFVFENEARELFGVDMRDIAIDFQGALYAPAEAEPMRVITPEQKAAIEKARKAAAAKAAKANKSDAPAGSGAESAKPSGKGFVLTPEKREKLEAKLATMSPDKVAKVREALAAREAEAASAESAEPATKQATSADTSQSPAETASDADAGAKTEPALQAPATERDDDLEAKIALLDPEKAARVKAALAGKPIEGAPAQAAEVADQQSASAVEIALDSEVEAKLSMMDSGKAQKIRESLERYASTKGGE